MLILDNATSRCVLQGKNILCLQLQTTNDNGIHINCNCPWLRPWPISIWNNATCPANCNYCVRDRNIPTVLANAGTNPICRCMMSSHRVSRKIRHNTSYVFALSRPWPPRFLIWNSHSGEPIFRRDDLDSPRPL